MHSIIYFAKTIKISCKAIFTSLSHTQIISVIKVNVQLPPPPLYSLPYRSGLSQFEQTRLHNVRGVLILIGLPCHYDCGHTGPGNWCLSKCLRVARVFIEIATANIIWTTKVIISRIFSYNISWFLECLDQKSITTLRFDQM